MVEFRCSDFRLGNHRVGSGGTVPEGPLRTSRILHITQTTLVRSVAKLPAVFILPFYYSTAYTVSVSRRSVSETVG